MASRKRLGRFGAALFTGAIAAAFFGAVAPSVGAVTLETIQGHVRDAAGRPLANVGVTDGNNAAYTDASGYYSIGEQTPGSYLISLTRLGLDPISRTVTPTDAIAAVDFTMSYVSGVLFSNPALNSTLGITVNTFAPSTSCATWTDLHSNAKVTLTFTTTKADGSNDFHGTFGVGGLAEGNYQSTSAVTDCTTSKSLATAKAAAYTVDNTPPTIDLVSPVDATQTIFSAQPIDVAIRDSGSGVDPTTITVTLTDLTSNTSTTVASGIRWIPSNGVAVTPPQQLAQGDVYSVSVTGRDRAGNAVSASQGTDPTSRGFQATFVTPTSAPATIPATSCTVGNIDTSTQSRPVTCSNVPLNLSSATVTMGPTREGGKGFIEQTIGLTSALMETSIAGITQTQSAYQSDDPAWRPKTTSVPFLVANPSPNPQTVTQSAVTLNLGTLHSRVPVTWSSASLLMPSTPSQPSLSACADPTTTLDVPVQCTTDPFEDTYRVTFNSSVSDSNSGAAGDAQAYGFADYTVKKNPAQPSFDAILPYRTALAIAADPTTANVLPPTRNAGPLCVPGLPPFNGPFDWGYCSVPPTPPVVHGGCYQSTDHGNNFFGGAMSMNVYWCSNTGVYVDSLDDSDCRGASYISWQYDGCTPGHSPTGSPWASVDAYATYRFTYGGWFFGGYTVTHSYDATFYPDGTHTGGFG